MYQIGLNKDEARHIYSNPNNQAICPILTLASYLFVFIFVDANKLFPEKDQEKCFNTCLHRITKSNEHLYEAINPKKINNWHVFTKDY